MTELKWEAVPVKFAQRLREPKKPARPSEGAIKAAMASLKGRENPETHEVDHVIVHRFPSKELAEKAADELKRAGAYTTPDPTTVSVVYDPEDSEGRTLRFAAQGKRGRK